MKLSISSFFLVSLISGSSIQAMDTSLSDPEEIPRQTTPIIKYANLPFTIESSSIPEFQNMIHRNAELENYVVNNMFTVSHYLRTEAWRNTRCQQAMSMLRIVGPVDDRSIPSPVLELRITTTFLKEKFNRRMVGADCIVQAFSPVQSYPPTPLPILRNIVYPPKYARESLQFLLSIFKKASEALLIDFAGVIAREIRTIEPGNLEVFTSTANSSNDIFKHSLWSAILKNYDDEAQQLALLHLTKNAIVSDNSDLLLAINNFALDHFGTGTPNAGKFFVQYWKAIGNSNPVFFERFFARYNGVFPGMTLRSWLSADISADNFALVVRATISNPDRETLTNVIFECVYWNREGPFLRIIESFDPKREGRTWDPFYVWVNTKDKELRVKTLQYFIDWFAPTLSHIPEEFFIRMPIEKQERFFNTYGWHHFENFYQYPSHVEMAMRVFHRANEMGYAIAPYRDFYRKLQRRRAELEQ